MVVDDAQVDLAGELRAEHTAVHDFRAVVVEAVLLELLAILVNRRLFSAASPTSLAAVPVLRAALLKRRGIHKLPLQRTDLLPQRPQNRQSFRRTSANALAIIPVFLPKPRELSVNMDILCYNLVDVFTALPSVASFLQIACRKARSSEVESQFA